MVLVLINFSIAKDKINQRIVIIFVYIQKAMPEFIIKYKNAKALKALQDFAKTIDIIIEKPLDNKLSENNGPIADLPITFAKNPDVTALAGIWQGRDITLEELRKQA